jgi:hypothetical protein
MDGSDGDPFVALSRAQLHTPAALRGSNGAAVTAVEKADRVKMVGLAK